MTSSPPTCCLRHLNNLHLDRWLAAHHAIWWAVGLVFTVAVARVVLTRMKRRKRKPRGARGVVTAKLSAKLGYKDGTGQRCVETWPRNPQAVGAPIVLRYPTHRHPTLREVADYADIIASVVGGEWAGRNDGLHNRIRYTRNAPPFVLPQRVDYADLKPGKDLVPLGIRADGQQLNWNLAFNPHAHALVFGGTGSGKSNLMRLMIAAFAQAGALIDIVDAKAKHESEYEVFAALPCVRISRSDEDLTRIVLEFRAELDRRQELPLSELPRQPVRVLLIDEMWEFIGAVKSHWAATNPKATIKSNPVLVDLERVARLGRSHRLRLIVGTQSPSLDDIGGRGIRGQLGFAVALGTVPNGDGAMIFRTLPPPVAAVDGRGHVAEGNLFVEVQTAQLVPDDSVRLAARGSARFPERGCSQGVVSGVVSDVQPPETLALESFPTNRLQSGPDPVSASAPPIPESLVVDPRSPVGLVCGKCGHRWESTAVRVTSCPDCRASCRVPVGARD